MLPTTASLLIALVAAARAACRSVAPPARQSMTFEAPRELLDASTRDRALDEITSFGVDRVRAARVLADYAPAPTVEAQAGGFDASDPGAYPADTWDKLDALFAAAQPRAGSRSRSRSPGRCRSGRPRARRTTSPSRARRSSAFATAVGRRYGDRVSTWSIWNEPNQPQFLKPQYVHGQADVAEALPQALPGRPSAASRDPANGGDTILFGETSPRGNSHVVAPLAFLRGTLCLDRQLPQAKSCGRSTPAATRTTPTRRAPARASARRRGRRDDRRAAAAHHRAQQGGQGGRDHARPGRST